MPQTPFVGEPAVQEPSDERSSTGERLVAEGPPEPQKPAPSPRAERAKEGPFHIPSLDGLRAVSFFIVFIAHAGLSRIVPGYFGLSVFFFLSGFLITTLLRMEYDATQTVSFKQFYLRRVLRIFPPFYLVLAVASVLSMIGFLGGSVWVSGFLAQAFHFTNYWVIRNGWWDGTAPGTYVYWSLAIEEHFYVVFPLVYLWLRRRGFSPRQQVLALLGFCALVLAWRFVLVFLLDASKERTYIATDTRVDSIIAGCILAIVGNPVLDRDSVDERRLGYVWLPLGVASVLASLVVRGPQFEQTLRYTLQSFGLLPVFVAAIVWHDRGPFRVLNLAPVRYIGVISYSLYLMHPAALYIFETHTQLGAFVRGTIVLSLLVVLATLIYRYVEKPCAKLRRNLSRHVAGGDRAKQGAATKPIAA